MAADSSDVSSAMWSPWRAYVWRCDYLLAGADLSGNGCVLQGQYEFVNAIIGNAIPPEYINAVKKGFEEALDKGVQIGHKVQGVKVVLTDGQAHMVDSSELAFKLAAQYAFRDVRTSLPARVISLASLLITCYCCLCGCLGCPSRRANNLGASHEGGG